MIFFRRVLYSVIVAVLCAPAFAGSDDPPAWLQQAATLAVPSYSADVPAVILQNEQQVSVTADGHITRTTNFAIRILTHEGRALAMAHQQYDTDSSKVREFHAWLIRPGMPLKRYGKDETIDVAADANDVYNESRVKVIDAKKDADTGSVFGYQAVTEERIMFPQEEWEFQNEVQDLNACLPVLASRFTLALPSGWNATGVSFNHEKIEPSITGANFSWELRNLSPIDPEVSSPRVRSMAPRVAVSYMPPQGPAPGLLGARNFSSWTEVSRWYSELSDPQSKPDTAITAKAQELTAGAKTEFEKIRSIARYIQSLQYISIQIGVGRMRPHPAPEVFSKRYGDCKDKANLMRAMLKAIGIEAYPVLIYSGDARYVRQEWASPIQFNHCIVAIKVSPETQAATVVQDPKLGRLLIFDATDDDTPLGDLPIYEQSSLALVVAGDAGSLVAMPVTPPESNQTVREANVNLDAQGTITATVHEHSIGQAAVYERAGFRHLSRPEYNQMIQSWVTRGANGAKVTRVDPDDDISDGRFDLNVDFTAAAYAQLMQNRLLVFKPAIVSRRESIALTETTRKHPVVLTSKAYSEQVSVKLPADFAVDEMPDPVKLDTAFGSYATSYDVKDGQLIFRRSLIQRAATVPVEQYSSLRSFFEKIRAAEQVPVVLARK